MEELRPGKLWDVSYLASNASTVCGSAPHGSSGSGSLVGAAESAALVVVEAEAAEVVVCTLG